MSRLAISTTTPAGASRLARVVLRVVLLAVATLLAASAEAVFLTTTFSLTLYGP